MLPEDYYKAVPEEPVDCVDPDLFKPETYYDANQTDMHQFPTGAVRENKTGKTRYGLLSPFVEKRLADHLTKNMDKHGARNWEQGMSFEETFESFLRHSHDYQMGKTDEDHLISAYCNLHFLLHYEEMIKLGLLPKDLDDMPKPLKDKS